MVTGHIHTYMHACMYTHTLCTYIIYHTYNGDYTTIGMSSGVLSGVLYKQYTYMALRQKVLTFLLSKACLLTWDITVHRKSSWIIGKMGADLFANKVCEWVLLCRLRKTIKWLRPLSMLNWVTHWAVLVVHDVSHCHGLWWKGWRSAANTGRRL